MPREPLDPCRIEHQCDHEDCSNTAVMAVRTLGEDDERLLCIPHLVEVAVRLARVLEERNKLIDSGCAERMANHVMMARVDRKEI